MKITKREKKKMATFVITAFLGTILVTSAKEIWINGWFDALTPETMFLLAAAGLIGLYYYYDME